jgi:flagellar basal-body rod protein FlgF
MDGALLVSLSNQMALRRKLDIVSNNLANLSTTGFKRESALFEEFILPVEVTDPISGELTTTNLSYVRDYGTIRDLAEGHLETTGGPLDMAIEGADGFFVVSTPDGPRYTRNGHFKLDATGRVVDNAGNPLLAQGGSEIAIAPGDEPVVIASDGTISTRAGVVGVVDVVKFADMQAVKKTGDNLYETDQSPEPATGANVRQGMLEKSNVQPVVEMVQMIEILRSYQQSSEMIQTGEDLVRRAIQKIGEIKV